MQNRPIGVFDSGVGGLTILSDLQKLLPHEQYIYVADQAFAPYGKMSLKELQERTEKITSFLLSKQCKIIVIACNTATVSTVKELRKKFKAPIIGIVPVIKVLAKVSKTKKTAVFATPATIKSIYLDLLISEFGKGINVKKEGETGLETLIEAGDIESSKITGILKKHLLPLKNSGVDTIALGCTHYPFLRKQMQEILGAKVKILDSGGAVARQTKRVLEAENLLSLEKHRKDWYYTTGESLQFDAVVKKLTGKNIISIHIRI
jgi:glutamate racemase